MGVKYVFLVYSNVNIFLVKHYIETNKIESSNIIIFYDRVSLDDIAVLPGEKFDFVRTFHRKFVNRYKSIMKVFYVYWHSVYKINKFIREEIITDFEFYVPHLYWDTLQLFAINSKCKKVVYIEEGDMSYATEEELRIKASRVSKSDKLRRKFLSLNMLIEEHPFPDLAKNVEGLCMNNEAFPFDYIKKHVFDFKDVFKNDGYIFKENYSNSIIFLLEHITWMKDYEKEAYYIKLRKVLEYVKEQLVGKNIYLKPHPHLLNDIQTKSFVLQLIAGSGLEYKVINEPIELLISKFEGVKIFTHRSSLIRYCCYAGVKPYVWGMSLVPEEQRMANTLAFKFLDQHPEMIEFVE